MKSHEAALNPLEIAILQRMADQQPEGMPPIAALRLSRRELTGTGSFTYVVRSDAGSLGRPAVPLTLVSQIRLPDVPNGLGALLFFNQDNTAMLELFTYGDDAWTGNWEGFVLDHD